MAFLIHFLLNGVKANTVFQVVFKCSQANYNKKRSYGLIWILSLSFLL